MPQSRLTSFTLAAGLFAAVLYVWAALVLIGMPQISNGDDYPFQIVVWCAYFLWYGNGLTFAKLLFDCEETRSPRILLLTSLCLGIGFSGTLGYFDSYGGIEKLALAPALLLPIPMLVLQFIRRCMRVAKHPAHTGRLRNP